MSSRWFERHGCAGLHCDFLDERAHQRDIGVIDVRNRDGDGSATGIVGRDLNVEWPQRNGVMSRSIRGGYRIGRNCCCAHCLVGGELHCQLRTPDQCDLHHAEQQQTQQW